MRKIFLIAALSLGAYAIPGARAADQAITITTGKSFVIDSTANIERVAVATEDIVEAVAITQREVMLNGKAPGETSVIIWYANGAGRQAYDVTVEPSPIKIEALRKRIRRDVGETVDVELEDKSVLLRGSVRNQAEGERAMALAGTLGVPVNLLTVNAPASKPQILLKVRFADVDRSASQSLGANIFSTGTGNTTGIVSTQQFSPPSPNTINRNSSTFNLSDALNIFLFRSDLNLGATIQALEAKNLVQILAEPNVLALDGKEASFLAGGEFPYPVVQSSANGISNVTILFREFGIRLTFTPTITPNGKIRLEVTPEVSSLDYANGLVYQGFNIPGLSVRRVKTEVEVENNQSFAIAGLIDNRVTENLSKVPGLGDIPLFGKLFQSRLQSHTNSELMVVVTPELVKPTPAGVTPPTLDMPQPFLKNAPTELPALNPADTTEIAPTPQLPFEPRHGDATAAAATASTAAPQHLSDAVKGAFGARP
jgi:pilus assembly protein CpaC